MWGTIEVGQGCLLKTLLDMAYVKVQSMAMTDFRSTYGSKFDGIRCAVPSQARYFVVAGVSLQLPHFLICTRSHRFRTRALSLSLEPPPLY